MIAQVKKSKVKGSNTLKFESLLDLKQMRFTLLKNRLGISNGIQIDHLSNQDSKKVIKLGEESALSASAAIVKTASTSVEPTNKEDNNESNNVNQHMAVETMTSRVFIATTGSASSPIDLLIRDLKEQMDEMGPRKYAKESVAYRKLSDKNYDIAYNAFSNPQLYKSSSSKVSNL